MTSQPNEAVSLERLRDILAGCEGVTPGPWVRHESDRETSVVAPATGTVVVVPWGANTTAFHNAHRDAAHLARLDPQTISSIVTELLELRKFAASVNDAINTGDGSYRP